MTPDEEWDANPPVVCDPSMWGRRDAAAPKTNNPHMPPVSSPAHDYQRVLGRTPVKARNDRKIGWGRVDEKLRVQEDGFPRLFVYDNCLDLIRTLPSLQRSKTDPDDVGQTPKQEDHLADAARYGILHLDPKDPMATGRDDHSTNTGKVKPMTSGLWERKF